MPPPPPSPTKIEGVEKIFSIRPHKRFGRPHSFGRGIFGRSIFGDNDIFVSNTSFGACRFGASEYADLILLSGIYRKNGPHGGNYFNRLNYQNPKNPRTILQQAQRQKVTDGVPSWKLLTDEQKLDLDKRAQGKHMTGFNLYLREYLLSI